MNMQAFYVYYFTNTPIPKSIITEIEQYHRTLQTNSTKNARNIVQFHRAFNVGVYSKLSNAEKQGLCNGNLTDKMNLRLQELIEITNQKNYERDVKYANFPTEIDLIIGANKMLKYQLYGMDPKIFPVFESPSGSVHIQFNIDSVPFLDRIVRTEWLPIFNPPESNKKSPCWEETTYYISMVHNTVRLNEANANALINDLNNVPYENVQLAQAAIVCELNITRNYNGKYTRPYKLRMNSDVLRPYIRPALPITVNNIPPYLIPNTNATNKPLALTDNNFIAEKSCFFEDSEKNHLRTHLIKKGNSTLNNNLLSLKDELDRTNNSIVSTDTNLETLATANENTTIGTNYESL